MSRSKLQNLAATAVQTLAAWAEKQVSCASIFGAASYEDKIYIDTVPLELSGGTAVELSLQRLGLTPKRVNPGNRAETLCLNEYSLVFFNAHGDIGECGRLQGQLDLDHIPYTGSGVLASAICLQKDTASSLARAFGLITPPQQLCWTVEEIRTAVESANDFVVVKPARGGSSVGVSIIEPGSASVASLPELDDRQYLPAVVQDYIPGRDVTIGAIATSSEFLMLPPVSVRCKNEPNFYGQYEKMHAHWRGDVKYEVESAGFRKSELLNELLPSLLRACHIRGAVRADFRLANDGVLHFLEINTSPGLSLQGNLATAATACGISFDELIAILVASSAYDDPGSGKTTWLDSLD